MKKMISKNLKIENFSCSYYAVAVVTITLNVSVTGFKFVAEHREVVYEYVGSVIVEAQAPWDEVNKSPPLPTGWKVRGTFKLQRLNANTLAAAVRMHTTCKTNRIPNRFVNQWHWNLFSWPSRR